MTKPSLLLPESTVLETIIVGFGRADVLGQDGKSGQIDTGPSCEKHCKKRDGQSVFI